MNPVVRIPMQYKCVYDALMIHINRLEEKINKLEKTMLKESMVETSQPTTELEWTFADADTDES